MGKRQDQHRESELQPVRISLTVDALKGLGMKIVDHNKTTVRFLYNGNTITVFPYSGWFSGKGIQDGRGLVNLLKQIQK